MNTKFKHEKGSHAVMAVFIILSMGFGSIIGCFITGYSLRGNDWPSYERGAHAVMLHHIYFDNYGSYRFRRQAFGWGDPQNKKDLEAVLWSEPAKVLHTEALLWPKEELEYIRLR